MPTSKSSISTSDHVRDLVDSADYKGLLLLLLSVIHRDGGQYTKLAGLAVSVDDAIARIGEMRMEIANLFRARKH